MSDIFLFRLVSPFWGAFFLLGAGGGLARVYIKVSVAVVSTGTLNSSGGECNV